MRIIPILILLGGVIIIGSLASHLIETGNSTRGTNIVNSSSINGNNGGFNTDNSGCMMN